MHIPIAQDASQVSISEVTTTEGYWYLQLKVPSKKRLRDGFWNFLERYGFRYGGSLTEDLPKRTLLPCEVCSYVSVYVFIFAYII